MKTSSSKDKKKVADDGPIVVPRKTDSSLQSITALPDNWKHAMAVCGSNAFHQLHVQGIYI